MDWLSINNNNNLFIPGISSVVFFCALNYFFSSFLSDLWYLSLLGVLDMNNHKTSQARLQCKQILPNSFASIPNEVILWINISFNLMSSFQSHLSEPCTEGVAWKCQLINTHHTYFTSCTWGRESEADGYHYYNYWWQLSALGWFGTFRNIPIITQPKIYKLFLFLWKETRYSITNRIHIVITWMDTTKINAK